MVKEGWKEEKLGNVIELQYGKGLPKRARKKGKFPVYGSGGIVDNHNKSMIKGPGIIVGRKGNVGSVYYSKEDFFPIDTVFYIENNPNKCNLKFIYYLLKNSTSIKLSSDAAVPGLNRNYALSREFTIPEDIDEQQKIALILSNYDDIIENNIKRIQLLEKIAKLIYDEWFVKFKFPGHENVKMVNSELGKIPEGWEVKSLYDVAEVLFGFALKSKLFCNDNSLKPIVRIRDIPKNKTETYSLEEIDEKYLIQNSDFLIGMDGIFHMCNWSGGNAYLNQRVARLRPLNDASKYYLFHAVKPNIERLNNEIVGTTVQHLSKGDFDRMKLIVPEEKIMRKFKEIVDPIYFEEIKLRLKNQNLRKTRDLLLPKLISGQVDVSDLDIKVPEMQEGVV